MVRPKLLIKDNWRAREGEGKERKGWEEGGREREGEVGGGREGGRERGRVNEEGEIIAVLSL